jgi:hypothetical protein
MNKINGKTFLRRTLALKLHKNISLQDTIIISGTPRGGTTWFMELIETLPDPE